MIADPNGQTPFEGDIFISQEILKLKEKFNIKKVLETGSQYGSTLKWFSENFERAQGCEPNYEFYEIAKAKGVNVLCIKSTTFLDSDFTEPNTLIYIDSHWHDTPCPLKEELKLIAELHPSPIICIHDFKVPNIPELGFDSYDYELKFEEIESLLNDIYPKGFDYHYNSELSGANRGIIFIYPKL